MEIIYDDSGTRMLLRKDDGTEVDLLKLETALVLTRNSRDWNRKRVVELEDILERGGQVIGENNMLQARINELEEKVAGYDRDRHTERDRADRERQRASELKDRLSSSEERVAELEAERERSADNHNTLADRVKELEDRLTQSRDLVSFKNRILNERDKELEALRAERDRETLRAEEAEAQFRTAHVCVGACTENSHVSSLGREALIKAENKVAELTLRIDKAREILKDPKVTGALNRVVRDQEESRYMSTAIEKALDALA